MVHFAAPSRQRAGFQQRRVGQFISRKASYTDEPADIASWSNAPTRPSSPIPPRTSAHPEAIAHVRSRPPLSDDPPSVHDVTRLPTLPQNSVRSRFSAQEVQRHELPVFSWGAIQEATPPSLAPQSHRLDPVTPPPDLYRGHAQSTRPTAPLHILPELSPSARVSIDELNTLPPEAAALMRTGRVPHARSERSSREQHLARLDTVVSPTASSKDRTSRSAEAKPGAALFPGWLDSVRWWLLRPGRLEFLMGLGGTLLLVILTLCFALVIAVLIKI